MIVLSVKSGSCVESANAKTNELTSLGFGSVEQVLVLSFYRYLEPSLVSFSFHGAKWGHNPARFSGVCPSGNHKQRGLSVGGSSLPTVSPVKYPKCKAVRFQRLINTFGL